MKGVILERREYTPTSTRPIVDGRWLKAMPPATDYIRHAAKLARKLQLDAGLGGEAHPDAEFWKTLAKALEECAVGLETLTKHE